MTDTKPSEISIPKLPVPTNIRTETAIPRAVATGIIGAWIAVLVFGTTALARIDQARTNAFHPSLSAGVKHWILTDSARPEAACLGGLKTKFIPETQKLSLRARFRTQLLSEPKLVQFGGVIRFSEYYALNDMRLKLEAEPTVVEARVTPKDPHHMSIDIQHPQLSKHFTTAFPQPVYIKAEESEYSVIFPAGFHELIQIIAEREPTVGALFENPNLSMRTATDTEWIACKTYLDSPAGASSILIGGDKLLARFGGPDFKKLLERISDVHSD